MIFNMSESNIGSAPVINSLSATANGTYTAPSGVDGYNPITVNVPNTYAAGDEGKVVSNGALVSQTSDTATDNGTYDTTLINSLTVNVSGGGGGGAEITQITGIIPDVGERGDISISFPADALPCLIVVGNETTSYELTSSAQHTVLIVYFNLQGTWRMTRAYGTKNITKYYVKRGSTGATGIVEFSNGIVTINDATNFSGSTTYTVEYVI